MRRGKEGGGLLLWSVESVEHSRISQSEEWPRSNESLVVKKGWRVGWWQRLMSPSLIIVLLAEGRDDADDTDSEHGQHSEQPEC